MKLRLGTRGSALALAQSEDVARRLRALGHHVDLVVVSTTGDQVADRPFAAVGAFGVFVRELESALLEDRIDLAVHSFKDVPSRGPVGLAIAAVPERVDPADVLLVRRDALAGEIAGLPLAAGARVGTSAARRSALLRAVRPDLDVAMLRGNVPTRVRALGAGRFDAIVIAAAGLQRLGRAGTVDRIELGDDIAAVRLDPSKFVPAPSQGAIAVQARADARAVLAAVSALDDADCRRTVAAERAALALADGGCSLPFGAWCVNGRDGSLTLTVALAGSDGAVARSVATGPDPGRVAADAWADVSRAVTLE